MNKIMLIRPATMKMLSKFWFSQRRGLFFASVAFMLFPVGEC